MKNRKLLLNMLLPLLLLILIIPTLIFWQSKRNKVLIEITFISKEKGLIKYKITNNTKGSIAIYPDTCATRTTELYKKESDGNYKIQYPMQRQCKMGVPTMEINSKLEHTGSYIAPEKLPNGEYKLELKYGKYEEGSWSLNDEKTVSSKPFQIED